MHFYGLRIDRLAKDVVENDQLRRIRFVPFKIKMVIRLANNGRFYGAVCGDKA